MQESADKIIDLILKSLRDEISDSERKELDKWLSESPAYRQVYEELTNEHSLKSKLKLFGQVDTDTWWKKINEKIGTPEKEAIVRPMPRRGWRYAVAVLLVILAAAGVYYFFFKKENPPIVKDGGQQTDSLSKIGPGGNYATLTLPGGRQIRLLTVDSGRIVAEEGNIRAVKQAEGQLVFENIKSSNTSPPTSGNFTLITPNGGKYSLVLPDGSRAWLNAASSISYPGIFSAKERRVSVSGEVYFDVKASGSPFIVKIIGKEGKEAGEVQVMGTTFNINAYPEESSIKTTLVKGRVKVKSVVAGNGVSSKEIDPGQQAIINSTNSPGKIDIAKGVDVEKVLAWQRGVIAFDATPFPELMRQVGRWYDVEISYEKGVADKFITGDVSRTDSLSTVLLKIQTVSGIRFRTEGRKVIVLGE